MALDLRRTFENRSGRVIAALRVALAFVFLVSLAFEPIEPGQAVAEGLVLMGSYLLFASAILAIIWRSWWLDHRLARPLLLLDIAVFLAAVFVTEGYDSDFTSPFLALFALIVLSTTLRWGWVVAARAGAVVSLLFILLGLGLMAADFPLETYRFSRRAFYMVALLLVLVWFGIDRRGPQLRPLALVDEGGSSDELCRAALAYAMQATAATRGLIAWADSEEPWTDVHEARSGEAGRRWRAGPEEQDLLELDPHGPCLFDLAAGRALVLDGAGHVRGLRGEPAVSLASAAGVGEGLALPLACSNQTGLIVLAGIPGLGADFLALGGAAAREIERAADRATATRLERETAVMRARGAIARDLHDSVAQSLAGACFRLEALRRRIATNGSDDISSGAAAEIASVRDGLRGEQSQVRGLIEALRDPAGLAARAPLAADLEHALVDAAAHWNITARFAAEGRVEAPGGIGHELRQLLREAVANAARHGHARTVEARLAQRPNGLELVVADDGAGFAEPAGNTPPWSISERISALGGQLEVLTGQSGTRLTIFVPLPLSQDHAA